MPKEQPNYKELVLAALPGTVAEIVKKAHMEYCARIERLEARILAQQAEATPILKGYLYGEEFYEVGNLALNDHIKASGEKLYALAEATPVASCPDASNMGEHACSNREHCWEPCGVLGKDGNHAAPVASAEKPELTVWYGAMPESNGKSNFTAILKRKDASMFDTDSYAFSVSEYPGRVQYDADAMRYLIGELAERPCPLDYDADTQQETEK